jgi:hypothetical protein
VIMWQEMKKKRPKTFYKMLEKYGFRTCPPGGRRALM